MVGKHRRTLTSTVGHGQKRAGGKVDHPAHYAGGGIEVIDAIEAWNLDFSCGSAVKYLARAGLKPGESKLTDLRKAEWYVRRLVQREERRGARR